MKTRFQTCVAALQPQARYSLYFKYHIQNTHFHQVRPLQTYLISDMMQYEPLLMFSLATIISHKQHLSSKGPLSYIETDEDMHV